jgi:hypothetical protein
MTIERPMFPPAADERCQIIQFSTAARASPKRGRSRENVRNGPSMQTFVFRSYDLIVESNEADLIRDVSFDIDKAQTKLKAVRRRLKGVQEQAAAKVHLLTTAETKLAAAIVAALLSTREGKSDGS